MRGEAITLEEERLGGLKYIGEYPWLYERHRVFPAIFDDRRHKKIIDLSAGVGCVAQRIRDHYQAELVCNDINPTCLKIIRKMGVSACSFDLDDHQHSFPFIDGQFDAAISLHTIEHLTYPGHFLSEIHRILKDGGYLYISTPNYASLYSVLRLLISGKLHNPLSEVTVDRYEFYSHIRYFTFKTLLSLVSSFGFVAEAVYVILPHNGSCYQLSCANSRLKAFVRRYGRWLMYYFLPPRWIAEPIICFQKRNYGTKRRPRKVVF